MHNSSRLSVFNVILSGISVSDGLQHGESLSSVLSSNSSAISSSLGNSFSSFLLFNASTRLSFYFSPLSSAADSITMSGDERELGKVCVRVSYQEATEQVWITLGQVGLHTYTSSIVLLSALLNGSSVCPQHKSLC